MDFDDLQNRIKEHIYSSKVPLETKEVVESFQGVTRTRIMLRLHILRGEGDIRGRKIGAGKGTWIWWGTNGL